MAEIGKPVELCISRPSSAQSPPNCAICLGPLINKCLSDACIHEFCFTCLVQWSKIKAECPLCKQRFAFIRHNCKPNGDFDKFEVKPVEEVHLIDAENFAEDFRFLENLDADQFLYLPTPPPTHHEFLFRTTFTVDTGGEHAIQQMLLTHPLTNAISISGFGPTRIHHRRARDSSATTFRRSIYNRNLWVYSPPDLTGGYRDVSPGFYRRNPAARHRLAPWLNRELNALLHENTQQIMRLVDIIMDLLLDHHICSRTFRMHLHEHLGSKTDHFVHEFYNFMRSPYDMIGYDRHVIYNERPRSPVPYIDVSDVDSSSDVILIGSDHESPRNNVVDVIDLIETDSDEPIIVSEEPAPVQNRVVQTEELRLPKLPEKLEMKCKRHSRSKRNNHKRRRRHRNTSSCSSSSSSSSSSTSTSNSRDESLLRRRKQRRKLMKIFKKWKNKINIPDPASSSSTVTSSTSTSTSTSSSSTSSSSSSSANSRSDSDSDIPLAKYATQGHKRSKHSHTKGSKRHKSHTITKPVEGPSKSSDSLANIIGKLRENLPTSSRYEDSHTPPLPTAATSEESGHQVRASSPLNLCIRKESEEQGSLPKQALSSPASPDSSIVENTTNPEASDASDSGSSNYPYYKYLRFKKEVDQKLYAPGPSGSGRDTGNNSLAMQLEEARNLWYSRPGILKIESDSHDSD